MFLRGNQNNLEENILGSFAFLNKEKVKKTSNVSFSGIGLHTGKFCSVFISVSDIPGIHFSRKDIINSKRFLLSFDNITDTSYSTLISNKNTSISTIEHLLSVLHTLEITNINIDAEGPEIPILDGSSIELFNLLNNFKEQNYNFVHNNLSKAINKKSYVSLNYDNNDSFAIIEPHNDLLIDYTIDFKDSIIGKQNYVYDSKKNSFKKDISFARTFVLKEQIDYLRKNNKALGGSLDNAIVFDKTNILNDGGLRDPLECVKHKILDLIGDLYVIGKPIKGKFTVNKGGHSLHKMIVEKII
jgi:UDP-3-O-[3-hydroxymyristoyl] N-acetylglucosamine deacetylase